MHFTGIIAKLASKEMGKTKKISVLALVVNIGILGILFFGVEFVLRHLDKSPVEEAGPVFRVQTGTSLYFIEKDRVRTEPSLVPPPEEREENGHLPIDLSYPKPQGTRRIVLVGSSPIRGVPRPGSHTADTLAKSFKDLFPGRGFEVVDATMPQAFADHIAWVMTQLSPIDPDLVVLWPAAAPVIYHDMEEEYIAGKETRISVARVLGKSRTYAALRDVLFELAPATKKERAAFSALRRDPSRIDPDLSRFMRRLNAAAAKSYGIFLEDTIARTKEEGVRVLLILPPTCLTCQPPLFSIHAPDVTDEQAKAFAQFFEEGEKRLERGAVREAVDSFVSAKKIDPEYALVRWRLGQAYRKIGDLSGAKAELAAAVEFDASSESIREPPEQSTREIARRYGLRVFDMDEFLSSRRPGGIIDEKAMIDPTHLTLDMQLLFSEALAKMIGSLAF